jgi:hypothetical protein
MPAFFQFGYDQGVPSSFKQSGTSGDWELPIITRWPSLIQMNIFGFGGYPILSPTPPRNVGLSFSVSDSLPPL